MMAKLTEKTAQAKLQKIQIMAGMGMADAICTCPTAGKKDCCP